MKPVRMQHGGLWVAAAGLPAIAHGASLFVNVEPGAWFSIPAPLRWALAADALLYVAGCVLVAAPVAGVAVSAHRKAAAAAPRAMADGVRIAWPLLIAVLLFAASSSLFAFGWRFGHEDATAFVGRSHTTLIAVALALAAWGALCGAWFSDPLDAAAFSLVIALAAAGGLLVSGAAVADLPRPMIALGLIASPLVVIASAAQIDIVRMDLLYQISPLAHVQIDYPVWHRASAWYLSLAFVCFFTLTLKFRTWQSASAS
jgi:hypothetical protein